MFRRYPNTQSFSFNNLKWGAGVSLSFGQSPKALWLIRLRRRRKQIGGLYLLLLQAGAREHFAFVVAEERVQFKLIFLMMKLILRNITKFNILTLKTWCCYLSAGRWFSGVVLPPSRYLPCGWVRNRCRCGGSVVISRSQQGAAISLLLARSSKSKASRWRGIGCFAVAKSQVGRGTDSA